MPTKAKKTKTIRCRTCGKVIRVFRYNRKKIPKGEILAAIRRHYKRNHPEKFKKFAKKAIKTKKEKGIIE